MKVEDAVRRLEEAVEVDETPAEMVEVPPVAALMVCSLLATHRMAPPFCGLQAGGVCHHYTARGGAPWFCLPPGPGDQVPPPPPGEARRQVSNYGRPSLYSQLVQAPYGHRPGYGYQ